MTMKDLLACVTPGANEYIQKIVNSKNRADYQKLKKLFEGQLFEAKSFDDTELDVLTFDWQSQERDRNWWWQLQALPFLNWYINSLELQNEEERSRYFLLCLGAINCWINQAKQNRKSPLAWHDHAAAFRVRNLTNWLIFCQSAGLPVSEEVLAEPLASLIIEHLDWLQEDNHYSKHTNHGFDQAMIALTVALMFSQERFEMYRQCNRQRLKEEVTFAFTDEGVHKENSPGYQKLMLGRLKLLRTLAPLGEKDISQMGECYVQKAENFLRAITLPDGYLPMIGDTQGHEKGLLENYSEDEYRIVFDYSDSGYLIVKGKNNKVGVFFLLIKNCHFSNYHRHDDDLMIYLWLNGEVVLGDGGLYSHNEKDPIRKHLRSHLAHTTVFVKGKAVRDKRKLVSFPSIFFEEKSGLISAESYMFGRKITRKLDISNISDGIIKIKDDSSNGAIFLNFCFGEFAHFNLIKRDMIKVNFMQSFIKIMSTARFNSLFGGEGDSAFESSYLSYKYGSLSENVRMVLSSPSPYVECSLEFGLKS